MSSDPFNVLDPRIQRVTQILYPVSLRDFENLLYEDIDTAVVEFTSGLFTTKKEDYHEDEISRFICTFLKGRFYRADTGVFRNGETDIVIKDNGGTYEIICEAKKFDMNKLTDGAYQLITRYSRGNCNQSGVLLIYINEDVNTAECMDVWCQYFLQQSLIDKENLKDLAFSNCEVGKGNKCRISVHVHAISGDNFKIRHIPVNYFFNPQEKTRPKQGSSGKANALATIEAAKKNIELEVDVKEYVDVNAKESVELDVENILDSDFDEKKKGDNSLDC
jgi:hypothetical protein